jgi:hypothetical protein
MITVRFAESKRLRTSTKPSGGAPAIEYNVQFSTMYRLKCGLTLLRSEKKRRMFSFSTFEFSILFQAFLSPFLNQLPHLFLSSNAASIKAAD